MRKKATKQLNNYLILNLCFKTALTDKQVPVRVSAYLNGYMSFRPMQFQPITLSTACNFNRLQFQPILLVEGRCVLCERPKTN